MKKTTRRQKRWAINYLRSRKLKAAEMLLAYDLENILIYDKDSSELMPIKLENIDREKYLAGRYTTAIVLLPADDITYGHGVKQILNSEDKWERGVWHLFKAWIYVSDYLKLGHRQRPCYNTTVNDIIQLVSILYMHYMLNWLDYKDEQMELKQDMISFGDYIRNMFTFYRNMHDRVKTDTPVEEDE